MKPQKKNMLENDPVPEEGLENCSYWPGLILAAMLLGGIFLIPLLSRWIHY